MGLPPEDEFTRSLDRLDDDCTAPEPPAELRERILAAARDEPQQQKQRPAPKRGRRGPARSWRSLWLRRR